jgi:hypothetical protein
MGFDSLVLPRRARTATDEHSAIIELEPSAGANRGCLQPRPKRPHQACRRHGTMPPRIQWE